MYILVGAIILTTLTVFAIGPTNVVLYFAMPDQSFEDDLRVPAPDYSKVEYWAALPELEDLSDRRPEGVERDTFLSHIDVFYIHPTGYLKGHHWNSLLDPNSATEENTQWMLANQASVFSDCNVYAPRYREATIYSFINREGHNEQSALQLAYEDVLSAFDYYLQQYNKGKPFFLASHSQGSYHAFRLIEEKIDGQPLSRQLIAAYTIGMATITEESVARLREIDVCKSPNQTGCLIHWATFAANAPRPEGWGKTMICVNPLTWTVDEEFAKPEEHKGYVPASGEYNLDFYGKDELKEVEFQPLGPPVPAHTYATCREGRLLVEQQDHTSETLGKGNYHGWDYQLFHLDIRENLGQRARAFLNSSRDKQLVVSNDVQ